MAEDATIGEELARWGKVVRLETRGRRTGRVVSTAVGFVEQPDGEMVIAAGDAAADWARNLVAEPICQATVGERRATYMAELLAEGPERSAAVTALILKYGTPAERLGHGPVFRLYPTDAL